MKYRDGMTRRESENGKKRQMRKERRTLRRVTRRRITRTREK